MEGQRPQTLRTWKQVSVMQIGKSKVVEGAVQSQGGGVVQELMIKCAP